jgi:SAM-dependent methyltransferase
MIARAGEARERPEPTPPRRPSVTVMAPHDHPGAHHHGHVQLDEAAWENLATQTELEGELLLGFVTDAARWVTELRGPDAPAVRQVLDIGSGPGVGTCELARCFPDAHVVAVDSSPAMLERARRRIAAHGLDARIGTHLAELPHGLDELEAADVIWASMSLHHVGDEVAALRVLHGLLEPPGLLAVAERAEPMRVLPDDFGIGRPGLAARLDEAGARWFAAMRDGLTDAVPSADLSSMLTAAGFEVAASRLARLHVDPPLPEDARRAVLGHLRRTREQLADSLDDDDRRTLDVLVDADDRNGVMHRADVFVAASRRIAIARPAPRPDEGPTGRS